MTRSVPIPGLEKNQRLSEEGLQRLEAQLQRGAGISPQVLAQWIRRYGEPARAIILKHGQLTPELGAIEEQ